MFENITPKLDLYEVNDWMGKKGYGIAIQLYEDGIPYARLTTSFGEFIGLKNAAYIDTNNFPKALAYIERAHMGIPTGFTKQSGFCEYPLVMFDEDFLKKLNPTLYKMYSDKYDELMGYDEEVE